MSKDVKKSKSQTPEDVEKFVVAVDEGDNVKASKLLEKTMKAKVQAKIKAALNN